MLKLFEKKNKLLLILLAIVLSIIIYRFLKRGKKYSITPADENNWTPSLLSDEFNEVYNSYKISDEWDYPVLKLMALNDAQFKQVHNDYNRRFMLQNGNETLDEAIKSAFWISSDVLAKYIERSKILYG